VSQRIAWYWRLARRIVDLLDDHVPDDPESAALFDRLEAQLDATLAIIERERADEDTSPGLLS
jgi:hypothetical protein